MKKSMDLKQLFAEASGLAGKSVTVCGWVKTIRSSKAIGFIELNDGTCFKNLQIVFEEDKVSNFADIAKMNVGSALYVEGEVVLTPEMRQPFEIHAKTIEVEGDSPADYPLQKKRHSPEFLRTIAHLRARTNLYGAAFRVRSVAAYAIHK
ncbi:MAG: asparagine--tRNA ligase, partial [Oscillospiraceae bacterium]|nr:asparagine--tRNA ligase [Oscillospiraceae bacterium]